MIEAAVSDDWMGDGVSITLRNKFPDGDKMYATGTQEWGGLVWERLTDQQLMESRRPTLRLDGEAARALMDALVRHFGGLPNEQMARQDLDYERKRGEADRTRLDRVTASLEKIAIGLVNNEVVDGY